MVLVDHVHRVFSLLVVVIRRSTVNVLGLGPWASICVSSLVLINDRAEALGSEVCTDHAT